MRGESQEQINKTLNVTLQCNLQYLTYLDKLAYEIKNVSGNSDILIIHLSVFYTHCLLQRQPV